MDIALIAIVAALAAALTFVSGFGLGTLLLPAFALFLPAPLAVAATAIVHLLHNLFKGALLWRRADWGVVLRFGLPAVPGAILGGLALAQLGTAARLFAGGPTGASFAIGLTLVILALLELQPWFRRLAAPIAWLPVGGFATGFLGGLTGQQGALRSIFLLRVGLPPDRLIATGGMTALLIDGARLGTYAGAFGLLASDARAGPLILAGALAALIGNLVGKRLLDKVTSIAVRNTVAVMMIAIGFALMAGLIGA